MKNINNTIEEIISNSYLELKKVKSYDDLTAFEREYLIGKDSYFSKYLSQIKLIDNSDKKVEKGKKINKWKSELSLIIEENKKRAFSTSKKKAKLSNDNVPKISKNEVGSFHLIRKSLFEIYSFFISRRYEVFESDEVETEWYNFDSLNLEKDHPARSLTDTFYFSKNLNHLLRTHTSGSQSRLMENNKNKEIMAVSGGKVYRNDDDDLTHSHQYTNIEILRIGKKISFANLKWMLEDFFQWFFEREIKTRFRPSFFPFTEPSFEVDVSCSSCYHDQLKKCKVCKGTGWIEILGAGLVNSNVLKNNGYDEEIFSGFAAGIGLERILMIKYGINDIRDFYLNDPRFLIQTAWK